MFDIYKIVDKYGRCYISFDDMSNVDELFDILTNEYSLFHNNGTGYVRFSDSTDSVFLIKHTRVYKYAKIFKEGNYYIATVTPSIGKLEDPQLPIFDSTMILRAHKLDKLKKLIKNELSI